jgi:hypothetical protein
MHDDDLTIIGRCITYGDGIGGAFGISRADRHRHLYMQGKTGSGKSTLLLTMAIQDIERGDGLCFIDPLGHNAEELPIQTGTSFVPGPPGRPSRCRSPFLPPLAYPAATSAAWTGTT